MNPVAIRLAQCVCVHVCEHLASSSRLQKLCVSINHLVKGADTDFSIAINLCISIMASFSNLFYRAGKRGGLVGLQIKMNF